MLHTITKRNPAGEKLLAYADNDIGEGNETKRIATKRIATKRIPTKRIAQRNE